MSKQQRGEDPLADRPTTLAAQVGTRAFRAAGAALRTTEPIVQLETVDPLACYEPHLAEQVGTRRSRS